MPTHTTKITIEHRDDQVPPLSRFKENRDLALIEVGTHLEGLASGSRMGKVSVMRDDGDAVAATGTVTLSGASGTVGATINGVSITVGTVANDTATAAALAATINASVSVLVLPFVSASSALGVVTVTAKAKGAVGNTITLAATGTGATASGNRLTGGTDATTAGVFTLDR